MSLTLTAEVLRRYPNAVFLETGTHHGGAVAVALECGFERVVSIEIDPKYHAVAAKRFESDSRVELVLGDSALVFREVIASLNSPATIWLDAHRHDNSIDVRSPTALIQELDVLAAYPAVAHSVLIDDVRVIRSGALWGGSIHGGLDSVLSKMLDINPNFQFRFENNRIARCDILVGLAR
ncbi:MAG: hypothetical protein WD049_00420 [Candidatus Paceibacterota bacterium]